MRPRVVRPSGIKNIGNSCYISSSVQCLKHTKLLWEFLIDNNEQGFTTSSPALNRNFKILNSFTELLHSLKDDGHSVNPYKFKKVIADKSEQFAGTDQSDAQEFLSFLIDALHEELNITNKPIFEELFYGTFKSTIKCSQYNHQSIAKEPFMCLSLPIEEDNDSATIHLYTKSNHLLIIDFKYDGNTTVKVLNKEIQRQVIVESVNIYLVLDKEVLILKDNMIIKEIARCNSHWKLCGIEGTSNYLIRVDIIKQGSFLISGNHEDNPQIIKERVREIISTNKVKQELDFKIVSSTKGHMMGSIELKATAKASEIKQVWKKLTHKQIDVLGNRITEDKGTLYWCLRKFGRREKLQGSDQWKCSSCGVFTDAEKSIEYQTLPKILIIHLKRFKVFGGNSRKKVSSFVEFPIILFMPTTDRKIHMYSLYAIINHMGSIERGHYTAYCRNLKNRAEWLEFDDNKVKPIDTYKLVTEKAYVLLYERV